MEVKKASLPLTIPTPYGTLSITEPVFIELIHHPIMQRLKNVCMSGISAYVLWDKKLLPFSRYDHSIGVWTLVRLFGGSLTEQIAALLHDASHTVFSHVGDYLFKSEGYQDSIHSWYLARSGIKEIVDRHGYSLDEIAAIDQFPRLEQDLPAMCADRLEYTLHNALLLDKISHAQLTHILSHLGFEHNLWYTKNAHIAEIIGHLSLDLDANMYAFPLNCLLYKFTAQALSRALEIGLITPDDIHLGTDEIVLEKLRTSDDWEIKTLMNVICAPESYTLQIVTKENAQHSFSPKFRGIDPLVKTTDGLKQLTTINSEYKKKYEDLKNKFASGIHIK